MSKKQSWREYLESVDEKIHVITPEWEHKYGKGKILIPAPRDIERIIRQVEKGKLITVEMIRDYLAKEKNVKLTASTPTSIYLKKIALASEEEQNQNKKEITPYWRVLKLNGLVNEKFPGGLETQLMLLKKEGHDIELFGKRKKVPKVVEYEKYLIQLK